MKIESHALHPAGICPLCVFAVISLSVAGARATDADGDGIEASWKATYSGAPAYMSDSDASDAWEDPDGDLLTNSGESQAGTNPGNADSDCGLI